MQFAIYPYKRGSTLPRRTFIVNVTVNHRDALAVEVTAPDANAAEQVVRNALNASDGVTGFSFDLIREVEYAYNSDTGRYDAPVIRVPTLFEGRITVTNRFAGTALAAYG